jgi:hypothetical protein
MSAYVYRHIRLDKNQPFYIGIGRTENYARAFNKKDKKLIGFIAQEFEEVFPSMVTEHKIKQEVKDEEGNIIEEAVYKKGIKEGKLIPMLVKAIQEQQAQIEELKAKLA